MGVSLCYLDYLQDHGLEKLKQKQLEYLKVITIGGGEDEKFANTNNCSNKCWEIQWNFKRKFYKEESCRILELQAR